MLSEGAEIEDHAVFMLPLTIYELTYTAGSSELTPCKEVDNWQRKSSLRLKKKEPHVAKSQKPSRTLCHAAGMADTTL